MEFNFLNDVKQDTAFVESKKIAQIVKKQKNCHGNDRTFIMPRKATQQ